MKACGVAVLSQHESVRTSALERGVRLYRDFNQFAPTVLKRVDHPCQLPAVLVELGEAVGIIYRSDKWQKGSPRNYIHFMEQPPRLACDVEGTQLFLIGGNYRITARGIEG